MLEPDEKMSAGLKKKIRKRKNCLQTASLQTGTIDTVTSTFDTIIYIDVLEHIKAIQKK